MNYFIPALYALYPQAIRTVGTEAFDVNGNLVEYDAAAVQVEANKMSCKDQAKSILQATDWTSIDDVGDSTKANPYLVNQAEFIAYRSTVRNYAVNPVTNPTFPSAPTEQWSA
jgi:hypothetical protein